MVKEATKEVLASYKRIGKRLVPPLRQLPNLKFFSYVDERLPHLIWLSALLLREKPIRAVHTFVDFVHESARTVAIEAAPSLTYLGNFRRLTAEQRRAIKNMAAERGFLHPLTFHLEHQRVLFQDYPLDFLFDGQSSYPREKAITKLREDVDALLDRYSDHSTQVQVTAVYSELVSGKMRVLKGVELPDFESIFSDPKSEAARRAASFARATVNAQQGLDGDSKEWPRDFWRQAFNMGRCE